MSQHISRKELKRDVVAETLAHGAEEVALHQRGIWLVAAAALVVGLAVFGWRFYSDRQTTKAAAAFEEAMKVFQARIRAAGEPEQPGEVSYVAEKNKFEDAVKKFTEVAQNYPRTRPGHMARYYAGLSQERLGRQDEAQKLYREAAAGGYEDLAALARFQLAGVLARTGKSEEAVQLYKQLMDRPAAFVPKPVVMLALADHYRKSNPQEATKLYEQLKKDFPNTAVAEEAEKRLENLPKT